MTPFFRTVFLSSVGATPSDASKTEKPVRPSLGTIYTCSQQRKDSKTKSEEGVVRTCREFASTFQRLC